MNLTKEELTTLLIAVEGETAKITKILLQGCEKPSESPMIQRLNSISRKANEELHAHHLSQTNTPS